MIWTEALGVAEGMRAADVFLALPQRPTAAFITADHLAVGFVHRLRQQGVRVPEDVAVVSHDDIRYAEFMEVPLTTVALPKYEIGRQAAQILFERIKEGNPQAGDLRQILLKPELVVRTSCGSRFAKSDGGLPMA
jgi:DNA-binding LacI/PurR family transcriptional regulator